jgi:hypothetical protein
VIALAAWVLTLPLRIAWQLGPRRTLLVVCLLVLGISVYGVAEDLGLLEPPAAATPASPPRPSRV